MSFVRLNEDGTYYAKYFDGGVMEAGTYRVLDEDMEYYADGGTDGISLQKRIIRKRQPLRL